MELGLREKTALVTGSSAGIGFAIARRLAREGASVAICGRRIDRLEKAAAALREETGARIEVFQADVTVPDDVERLVRQTREAFGRIDILVNNAGTGIYKPFLDVTEEELLQAMQMNFFAMFRVTQKVVPHMVEQGGGAIVNVTGTSGSSSLDPPFFSTCSGPAKAAENRFTKALATEFGPSNIRVNCVAPGRVHAPERFERWIRDIASRNGGQAVDPADLQREWGKRISLPDHRWADIEEIANLVVFAASPACGFMTGAMLVADGGETRD
jgi:3-oxoacyl-[acyl-carrier protein] reductase